VGAQPDCLDHVYYRIDIARGGPRFHHYQHIFKKGLGCFIGQRQISLVEKREESAPVEKRSLVIARLRAPKRTQHGCYLQPVSDDGFQRSLLSIIKPLLQMSINNSAIRTFIQQLLEPILTGKET
jgi:hypothetical protein